MFLLAAQSQSNSLPPVTTEVVKIYQEAGSLGVILITSLVIIIVLCFLLFRVLKLYAELTSSTQTNESLRIQAYQGMIGEVGALKTEVGELSDRFLTHTATGSAESTANGAKLDSIISALAALSREK